ncbi:parvalbumin beta-like isoform X2 [Hemitrygon akajei]|uniref:parvalbumin beta-like isoform X2 n=1 Tax=Hemitrygon akajei TaxID=2704970 RepID=UPI003BF995EA
MILFRLGIKTGSEWKSPMFCPLPTSPARSRSVKPKSPFNCKKFFRTCGLSKKTAEEIRRVFRAIDDDNSGFIEED